MTRDEMLNVLQQAERENRHVRAQLVGDEVDNDVIGVPHLHRHVEGVVRFTEAPLWNQVGPGDRGLPVVVSVAFVDDVRISMTPEEAARRAIACTATGALSGLPKWETCVGMTVHCSRFTVACRVVDVLRASLKRPGLLMYVPSLESLALITVDPVYPDFTHEPTVLAVLPLVRRAWTGHRLTLVWRENGNVNFTIDTVEWLADLRQRADAGDIAAAKAHAAALGDGHGTVFLVYDVPLYEALTLALEAAPEKS